jgi:hypothetical protein
MPKPARQASPQTLRDCLADAVTFAAVVLGVQPWPHQVQLLRCASRIIVVKAGRRAGKSTAAAVKALWKAFSQAGALTLIVSAGEDAAKDVLAECQRLAAASHLFRDFVTDEFKTEMRFANGSRILSIPKTEARIRGKGVDLLILDEAFQMPDDIWRAAEPATADRDRAQIWICSTPGNSPLHFFNQYYAKGLTPSEWVTSFHWPSTVSPLISKRVLQQIQEDNDPWIYRREYLAEDVDDSEAVFPDSIIFGATANGCTPLSPEQSAKRRHQVEYWDRSIRSEALHTVVLGVDPGGSRDPWAIAAIGAAEDHNAPSTDYPNGLSWNSRHVYAVFSLDLLWNPTETEATERVLELCRAYHVPIVIAESSGLGFHWARSLQGHMQRAGLPGAAYPLPTTRESKRRTMSEMCGAMSTGQLALPDGLPLYGELIRQMRSMGMEHHADGGVRLAARSGHDDAILACSIAWRAVELRQTRVDGGSVFCDLAADERATIAGGTIVPRYLVPQAGFSNWRHPATVG